jgi:hypothetical protein
LLFDYNPHHFFSGNKRRIEIGNMLNVSQTEGITFESPSSGFISAERITSSLLTVQPKLLHFDFTNFFENPTSNIPDFSDLDVSIFPNPANEFLEINFQDNANFQGIRIKDNLNRQLMDEISIDGREKINVSFLDKGVYFIELISDQKQRNIPFIKN